MGTKAKFWYRLPEEEGDAEWLFKFPRPHTGEHWAEKIAAEVAELLSIPHAIVELAIFNGERGTATESFAQDRRGLFHGNQLLNLTVSGYDIEKRYHQSYHTFQNILEVFKMIAFVEPEDSPNPKFRFPENADAQFAEYLILDAVVGNTDRHHENWGLLREWTGSDWHIGLAPTFDHASSLGRELSDDRRRLLLNEGRINLYTSRGRGGIYLSEDDRFGPSPLQLVKLVYAEHPALFASGLRKLAILDEGNILDIVSRIPNDWMTEPQREFAVALIKSNAAQLAELS